MENSTFIPIMETTYPELTEEPTTTTEEPITTTEEPRKVITGYIFYDKNPVENVLVTNISNNLQTLSDKSGYYDIIGSQGDSIKFDKYGYEKKYIFNININSTDVLNIELKKNQENYIWFISLIYFFFVLVLTCIVAADKDNGLNAKYPKVWGTWIGFCVICWILVLTMIPNVFPIGFAVYTSVFVVYLGLSLFFIIKQSQISKTVKPRTQTLQQNNNFTHRT